MSDDGSFWCGFAVGAVVILFMVFVVLSLREASRNKGSEILRVEYKNIDNGASREMIEDMVKTHFPSSKWENVECNCSKMWVKVELSNP